MPNHAFHLEEFANFKRAYVDLIQIIYQFHYYNLEIGNEVFLISLDKNLPEKIYFASSSSWTNCMQTYTQSHNHFYALFFNIVIPTQFLAKLIPTISFCGFSCRLFFTTFKMAIFFFFLVFIFSLLTSTVKNNKLLC